MSMQRTSSTVRMCQPVDGAPFAAGLVRVCLAAGARTLVLLAVLAAATVTLSGCGGRSSGAIRHDQAPVARVAQAAPTSAIVYVSDHGRVSVRTSGTPRVGATQRFRIGSVTKTFTATIVLQLAEEGKLRLDDTLERYLPGVVPGGQHITIHELLDHHSGLANYFDYTDWLARADRSMSTRPIDVLRFAASQPPVAPPNTFFHYSNTDYIALGLIIERVTGQSFAHELERRILQPLGLRNTQLATTRTVADLHDRGFNPSLSWAAGGIVSNAPDLVRFFSALLSAHVISPGSLAQMKAGLGIFPTRLPCGVVWEHDGVVLDYFTLVAASRDGHRVTVISQRTRSTPQPADPALMCSRHTTN